VLACEESSLGNGTPSETRKALYGDLITLRRLDLVDPSARRHSDSGGGGKLDSSGKGSDGYLLPELDGPDDDGGCWGTILRNSKEAVDKVQNRAILLDTNGTVALFFPWGTPAASSSSSSSSALSSSLAASTTMSPAAGAADADSASTDAAGVDATPVQGSTVEKSFSGVLPPPPIVTTAPTPHSFSLGADLAIDVTAAAKAPSSPAPGLQPIPKPTPAPESESEPATASDKALPSKSEAPPAAPPPPLTSSPRAPRFVFPPPGDCDVVCSVRDRAEASRAAPLVVVCKAGAPEVKAFEEGLVEDGGVVVGAQVGARSGGEGGGGSSSGGRANTSGYFGNYQAFAQALAVEVGKEAAEAQRK
jgi:hypothetical protein